ncbi:MAG: Hsp70 family protein [Ruminococcus sp.]|nr:Hsp70 family protein [Ruminococcus sp.]
MGRCFGIDLGTTNTVISFRDSKGKIKRIGDKNGENCIKTAILFESADNYCIGSRALSMQGVLAAPALCTEFKPRIKGENYYLTATDGTELKLKPVKAMNLFLNKLLKEYIEPALGRYFDDPELTADDRVVVTVPVKFNPEEKKAIKQAALKANYPNLRIVFEPTAAAVAITEGADRVRLNEDDVIAVYDLGGGTFDISVIAKKENGVYYPLDKGQDGDKTLGGNLISRRIITGLLADELEAAGVYVSDETDDDDFDFDPDEYGVDNYTEYMMNWLNLKELADEIKETFSDEEYDSCEFSTRLYLHGEEIAFEVSLTKEQYHRCIYDIIEKTVDITERVISETEDANGVKITKLILAGGSSQIALIKEMFEERFDEDRIQVISSHKPFDLISIGALILGEKETDLSAEEKTVSQFGVAEKRGMAVVFTPLIYEDKRLPVRGERQFEISEEIYKSGEISVRFYEKDVRSYHDALIIGRDEGLYKIAEYDIPIEKDVKPRTVSISFIIEEDGTISLEADFMDSAGNTIRKVSDRKDSETNLW